MLVARNTLKKDKRINLRLTQKGYHQIQIKAIEEGIPIKHLFPVSYISILMDPWLKVILKK